MGIVPPPTVTEPRAACKQAYSNGCDFAIERLEAYGLIHDIPTSEILKVCSKDLRLVKGYD